MIRPILALENPYQTAKEMQLCGWKINFSQPVESGDPLVGVSLYDNQLLLGVTEGYIAEEAKPYAGSGVVLYLTVPRAEIERVHAMHAPLKPSALVRQAWGDAAFSVAVAGYQVMIAAQ